MSPEELARELVALDNYFPAGAKVMLAEAATHLRRLAALEAENRVCRENEARADAMVRSERATRQAEPDLITRAIQDQARDRERLAALERENATLRQPVEPLVQRVMELKAENARLRAALEHYAADWLAPYNACACEALAPVEGGDGA